MAQTFFPIAPVDVTPAAGAYTDIDVNPQGVPAGATGVVLHIKNSAGASYMINVRKNGSTDARYYDMYWSSHSWCMIGIDENGVFEAKIENAAIRIYLVGYTMAGVTFNTNGVNKSLAGVDAWTDIDCAVEAPNAIGLIWEIVGAGNCGLRKNGSADDFYQAVANHSPFGAIIGCDDNQICEGKISAVAVDIYLLGYITDGGVFNTNGVDVSLGVTAAWTDLAAFPDDNPTIGFIQAVNSEAGSLNKWGLRKNGSAEAIYEYVGGLGWGIVECDENRIIEGIIDDTRVDYYQIGYANYPDPPTGSGGNSMAAKMLAGKMI